MIFFDQYTLMVVLLLSVKCSLKGVIIEAIIVCIVGQYY